MTLPTGKRKFYRGLTRDAVAKAVTKALRDLQLGVYPADDKITVEQYLNRWLDQTAKPTVRYNTYRGYEQCVRCHLIPKLGKYRLAKLTPDHVETFCAEALSSGRVLREKKPKKQPRKKPDGNEPVEQAPPQPPPPPPNTTLSPRTVQYCHSVPRLALKTAVRRGLVARNVASLGRCPQGATRAGAAPNDRRGPRLRQGGPPRSPGPSVHHGSGPRPAQG